MRIGVLTHSGSDDNYGQILQCYALQSYLKLQGHSSFLIKYSSDAEVAGERFHLLKQFIRSAISLVSPARKQMYTELEHYKKLHHINMINNQKRAFQAFLVDNVELTQRYFTYEELKVNAPKAKAYIVGSDQVWNLEMANPVTPVWYLQFGNEETLRISYAASIGRKIQESEYELFTQYLKGLNAISVREQNAYELCQKLGFKDSELVVDPTVLAPFSVYEKFIDKDSKPQKPYVFLYYLNVLTSEELEWGQISIFLQQNRLELKSVSSSGYYPAQDLIPGHKNEYLTIPEWLSAIYHSEYVISTSFHGVVFAILMHKPFVAIPLRNQYSGGNVRLASLLESIGLSDRIFSAERPIGRILTAPIDWNKVETLLTANRTKSGEFLKTALKCNIV